MLHFLKSKILFLAQMALPMFILSNYFDLGRLVERRVRHAAADVPVERGHRLLLHGGLLQLLRDGWSL